LDGNKTPAWLATLYQQGSSLEQAMKANEFMYVQFWNRHKDGHTLSDLLKLQEEKFKEIDPKCTIEFLSTIKRKDADIKLRVTNIKNYPVPEYTGFVEFEDFIFFCVMFSPLNRSKSNIRKLENIMEVVLPVKVNQGQANKPMHPTANASAD
jgi:hypothetical protein